MAKLETTYSIGKIRLSQRASTFLICLVVSILLWISQALSRDYITKVSLPLEYINLPSDKVLAEPLPTQLSVEVKTSGYDLVKFGLKQRLQPIVIDARRLKPYSNGNFFVSLENRKGELEFQLDKKIRIQKLFNDTIVFYFNPKSVKQVPVIPRLDIHCMPQYQVSDSIRIEPKYVGIAGMEREVAQVKYIETHPLAFRNLNQTTTKKIRLVYPGKKDQLELTTTEVTITIPVEKYTEAELEIPVEVENLPQDYTIKTFPEKVNARFMIPFGDYKNMHPGLFKAVINFEQAASGNNKLKVNIVKSPSSARSIKIVPEKVEFIIRK